MKKRPIQNSKKYSNVFNLKDMISMPLKAVIEANAEAAHSAISIIKAFGFERDPSQKNGLGKLKIASFTYDYKEKDGSLQSMKISIPFITLIPLPLLEIKKADFNFEVQILELSEETERKGIGSENMQAVFSTSKSKKSQLRSNMQVSVNMGQSDLPSGILKLLNVSQEAGMGETRQIVNFSKRKLSFTPTKPTQSVKIELPAKNANYIFQIKTYDENNIHPFSKPIRLLTGDLVGKSTSREIIARPFIKKNIGLIELGLKANTEFSTNGFIQVLDEQANLLGKLYFNVKSFKETKISPHAFQFSKTTTKQKIKMKRLLPENIYSIQVKGLPNGENNAQIYPIKSAVVKIDSGRLHHNSNETTLKILPHSSSKKTASGKIILTIDSSKVPIDKGVIAIELNNKLIKNIFFNKINM